MKKTLSYVIAALAVTAFMGFTSCKNATEKDETESVNEVSTNSDLVAGSIVYIDLERVIQEYDMATDLRAVVESKAQNISADVTRRQKKFEEDVNSFQDKINKGLMTQSVAEAQANKLQQQQQELEQYANDKNNEINEEFTVMANQIMDAIQTYVQNYNEEKGFALILTTQSGNPVIAADPSLDITDEILAGLNEEYIKNKNSK